MAGSLEIGSDGQTSAVASHRPLSTQPHQDQLAPPERSPRKVKDLASRFEPRVSNVQRIASRFEDSNCSNNGTSNSNSCTPPHDPLRSKIPHSLSVGDSLSSRAGAETDTAMTVTQGARVKDARVAAAMVELQKGISLSSNAGYKHGSAATSPSTKRSSGTSPSKYANNSAKASSDNRPEWSTSGLRRVDSEQTKPSTRSPVVKATRGRTPSPVARTPKPILKHAGAKKEEEAPSAVAGGVPGAIEDKILEGVQSQKDLVALVGELEKAMPAGVDVKVPAVSSNGSKKAGNSDGDWLDGLSEEEKATLNNIMGEVSDASSRAEKLPRNEIRSSSPEQKRKKERVMTPDVARRKAEVARLDGEIDRRRAELHKLTVAVASATVDKATTDLAVKRIKQELADWSAGNIAAAGSIDVADVLSDGEKEKESTDGDFLKESGSVNESNVTKMKVERDRLKVENEVLRRREASLTADVEYVEALLGKEREEGVSLRARLAEAKSELAKNEKAAKEAVSDASAARREAASAERRATSAEADATMLREQLAKAHAAEAGLLEQLQSAAKDGQALRAALMLAREGGSGEGGNGGGAGGWEGEAEIKQQLRDAMRRIEELETQTVNQAERVMRSEREVEEAQEKRKTAEGRVMGMEAAKEAAEGEVEQLRREVEELRVKASGYYDIDDVIAGSEVSTAVGSTATGAGGGGGGSAGQMRMNVPNRIWNLLEQVGG